MVYAYPLFPLCDARQNRYAGWSGIAKLRKLLYARREIFSSEDFFGHAAIFTSIIVLLFSLVSILIALTDPYNTAKKIKDMLGLNFEITVTALTLGVIGFGLLLMVIQFFVTKYSAKIFYSRLTESE